MNTTKYAVTLKNIAKTMLVSSLLSSFYAKADAHSDVQHSTYELPALLSDEQVSAQHFLPDFSYAGYANSEHTPDVSNYQIIDVSKHGIVANDGIDDSKALIALIASLSGDNATGSPKGVILQFGSGRYIISEIIYIGRSNLLLQGNGSGEYGTEFYFPRPLIYAQNPPELAELREYLVKLDKIQKEKQNNIYLPFTQWAWSGGFFWTRVEGQRVKKYLDEYDEEIPSLAKATEGLQGQFTLQVSDTSALSVGQIIELQWYNASRQKDDVLLQELYPAEVKKIGSHHWNFANLALSRQQTQITQINGKRITVKTPLLHHISGQHDVNIAPWAHLQDVGFAHFSMRFAYAERVAHHVEQGFNGIYLTRVYNGWVDDVSIENADSGILTEEVANITIKNVVTLGKKYAHYSVQMGAVHNVLVDNLVVKNRVEHPLSFNTFATKSVYRNSTIELSPVLDQHSGVNHQNLFDNIKVDITLQGKRDYPLFAGGGAGYWKPSHGAYNTFWNIQLNFLDGHALNTPVVLNGMSDGPMARVIGVRANIPISVTYGPSAYIEGDNIEYLSVPSLFDHQLKQRLTK